MTDEDIVNLYLSGRPLKEISSECGYTPQTVRMLARRAGHPPRPRTWKPTANPVKEEVLRLYRCGMKVIDIAEKTGLHSSSVSRISNQNGLKRTKSIKPQLIELALDGKTREEISNLLEIPKIEPQYMWLDQPYVAVLAHIKCGTLPGCAK